MYTKKGALLGMVERWGNKSELNAMERKGAAAIHFREMILSFYVESAFASSGSNDGSEVARSVFHFSV